MTFYITSTPEMHVLLGFEAFWYLGPITFNVQHRLVHIGDEEVELNAEEEDLRELGMLSSQHSVREDDTDEELENQEEQTEKPEKRDEVQTELIQDNPEPVLRCRRSTQSAILPTRGSQMAAGLDLFSTESKLIPQNQQAVINTNIQVELLPGCYGRIAPRSSLAAEHSLHVGVGVVDRDYRVDIKVVLLQPRRETTR